MSRWIAILSTALMLLAFGCGAAEDAADAAGDAAGSAMDAAENAAGKAMDTAGDVAGRAAAAGKDMTESAGSALQDVAAGAGGDAITRCLGLAAKKQWSDALEPCTEAAQKNPDDLRIKHAVQQAQAAAEG